MGQFSKCYMPVSLFQAVQWSTLSEAPILLRMAVTHARALVTTPLLVRGCCVEVRRLRIERPGPDVIKNCS